MEPTPCCLKSSIYNFLCVGTHQHDIIYYAPSVLPTSISASCHKTYPTKRRRLYSAYGICILCFYVYWVYSSRVYILPFISYIQHSTYTYYYVHYIPKWEHNQKCNKFSILLIYIAIPARLHVATTQQAEISVVFCDRNRS